MAGVARSVRVLVADDHPVYLDGIASAIRSSDDMQLVASCADGGEALTEIRRLVPDVAVLDMKMPALGATEVLAAIEREALATRVLVLSAFADGPAVYDSLEAGAAGYLVKDASRARICDAIRAIAGGRTVLGESPQTGIASELRSRRQTSVLTEREREILALLADGCSAPEISERLIVATSTVKTHLHHLYEKLGVTDRAAAVAEGMRRGMVR
jgi:two-component system nitrate/nitrite response regulator NarL